MGAEFQKLVNDELEPTGEKFITDLDKILKLTVKEGNGDAKTYVNAAMRYALLVRLYANIAIGRSDRSFAEKAEKEFQNLGGAIEAIGKAVSTKEEKKLQQELLGLFGKYESTFRKVKEDGNELSSLVDGKMRKNGDTIRKDSLTLKQETAAVEKEIREKTIAAIASSKTEMLILSIAGVVIGIGIGWFIGQGISKPVIKMTEVMETLAEGNLEVEIPDRNRTDEIGEMATAVQVFKDNAIRVRQMEAEQTEQKKRAEEEKRQLMNKMADDFQSSVGGVVDTVSSASTELQSSAQSMTAISEETSTQATAVAAASEEASTNVQTVASAAEELSSSISEISRQVTQSTEIAGSAVKAAKEADEMVQGLAMSANKIGEVVEQIGRAHV